MTKPSKILWFTFSVAALLLASRASAQTYVTPTVAPTPPGQLIVVNNGPAKDADDLHVSGDLVSYSYSDSTNFTVRYFNLATRVDAGVPNNGTFFDFLADVRGSVIVFTHVSSSSSARFQFDTANPSNPPVEVNPVSGSARQQPQIRDQTIAWQESSSGSVPSISGGPQNSLIAFSYLPPGGSFHDLALYKPATALEGPTSLEVQQ